MVIVLEYSLLVGVVGLCLAESPAISDSFTPGFRDIVFDVEITPGVMVKHVQGNS